MTLEEFNKLSPNQQGALWPICRNCKHIAQAHNLDGCYENGMGQCPECGTWIRNVKCKCKNYEGPHSVEELVEILNSRNKK